MTDLAQLRERVQGLLAGTGPGTEASSLMISETLFGPDDPLVGELLRTWNGGQPLVVHRAVLAAAGGDSDEVLVTGVTSFRNVDGAPVAVRFRPVDGGVAIRVRMTLPVTWRFSQSFPDLPVSIDFRGPLTAAPSPLFDLLTLTGAAFVLATHDHVDEELGVALPAGFGFAARLKLVGLFGIIEHTLGGGREELVIAGPVLAAPPVPTTTPLPPTEPVVPVPSAEPLPGINLRAVLDTDVTVGPLALRDTALVLYCPPDVDWLKGHPNRPPMVFYGGRLQGGDRFAVEVWAALSPGDPSLVLTARPEGGAGGIRTADLAGLLGGDELADRLGPELGSLGTVTLRTMSLGLSLEPPALDGVSATVGLDGIRWAPFGDELEVTDLHAIVVATSPLEASRSVQVILAGRFAIEDAEFTAVITVPDFTISVDVTAQPTLPLGTFMRTYLPDVPPVGDLTVDGLRLSARPGAFYTLAARLAPRPEAWTVPLGPESLEISDVGLSIGRVAGAGFTGSFSGRLSLAGAELDVGFQVPGPFALRADLPRMSLRELVGALTDQPVDWPPGFDIALEQARIRIEKRGTDGALVLGAQIEGFGSLAVDIRRAGARWGFAAGFALPTGWRLGQLSQDLAPLDEAFRFDRMVLVIASFDDPAFQFPDLSSFGDPRITSTRITLPASAAPGVKAGLNAFAEMDLGGDRGLALIKGSLHLDSATLDVLVQIGIDPVTALVSAGITGALNGNLQFTGALRIRLAAGSPSLGLFGEVAMTADGHPLRFTAELSITPNGALMAGTMPEPWRDAFGVNGLVLADLALLVGISWELIPAIGIAATMSLGDFAGSAALLFDGTQPTRSLLAGSISDLGLDDIATLIAGQADLPDAIAPVLAGCRLEGTHLFDVPATLAADLDTADVTAAIAAAFLAAGRLAVPTGAGSLLTVAEAGRRWHLTDRTTLRHYGIERRGDVLAVSRNVQLYLAPEPTLIGQLVFPAGTRLTAGLTAFGFGGQVDVDVDPNVGISVAAELLPVDAGVIFKLTGSGGTGGPRFSLATYDAPGAPVRGPHCVVSGAVTMLGFTRDIDLRLSRDGFFLTVSATIFDVFDATVTASLPLHDFAAAELGIGASMHEEFLSIVRTRGVAAIQSAAGDAGREVGEAQRAVADAQTKVDAVQRQIDPQVAQIRAERAQADGALRKAENDVNTIQGQIDAEQRTIGDLNRDLDRLKGQLTWWNSAWIGPQILDKGRQLAQHQLTLTGEQGGLAVAQGTLSGLRSAVNTTPVEADPRVAGLYAQLALEQAGLAGAQGILQQTQAAAGGLASVATWLAANGPDHLLEVTDASFAGSLGVVGGGQVTLSASYILLGQPGTSSVSFDFHDVEPGFNALVNLLEEEAAMLALRL